MKRRTMCYGVAVMTAAMLGLAACQGSGSSRSAETTAAAYDMKIAAETAAYNPAEASYEEGAPASGTGLEDTASLSPSVTSGRKLIRNVSLTVETDSFDQLLGTLTSKVGESGGYVEQSDISGNSLNRQYEPSPRYASLTVRIPLDKVDGFITAVEGNGNVTNKSESTQDVTLQYSDLESRKKSLSVEQDRIWALLEKADTLESVIALEERLSEIRYELESMESQLRLYDNQVEYSTVYLNINEIRSPEAFTPTGEEGTMQRIQNGFSRNLNSISNGLVNFFVWLAASSPYWVPLAAVAAASLAVIHRRKRRARKSAEPQAGEGKTEADKK